MFFMRCVVEGESPKSIARSHLSQDEDDSEETSEEERYGSCKRGVPHVQGGLRSLMAVCYSMKRSLEGLSENGKGVAVTWPKCALICFNMEAVLAKRHRCSLNIQKILAILFASREQFFED